MANLKLDTVSKTYPSGTVALYKVNLQLSDSEFIAVVGGEKCGKSTLLRVIAGLEEVTEGEIYIGDKQATAQPAKERDISMIFQGNTLYPSMNVYDNLAYGLNIRKFPDAVIEQRVKAVSELLGLGDVLGRKPKTLTAEQRQTVAFGRALVREPKLYLLDDPLAGIAPDVREKLRSLLVNLQMRVKGTFIYATKNVNEALTMATRILVLKDGFVQQIDTPANLYEYPANAYVAFTVGSPTVNFINKAKITAEGEEVYAVADGIKIALPENIRARFASLPEYAESGKEVILGIRPEDIVAYPASDTGVEGALLAEGTVTEAESFGDVSYVDCECEKLSLIAMDGTVGKGGGANKGDKVTLLADLTHMFIFDAETRLTLLERDGGYVETGYPDVQPLSFVDEERIKNKLKPHSGKKK